MLDSWVTTQITDGCGVRQLLCYRCMQAITADTVIAYITHDDWPYMSSASSRHGAKRRRLRQFVSGTLITVVVVGGGGGGGPDRARER